MRDLSKAYEPSTFEQSVYAEWEQAGCFDAADTSAPGQAAYAIMIPPPNVTGVLHMGHALTTTIEDILIRWRRMSGDNTLWMPGTDHAGIATQAQVEKQIAKEGKGPTGRPLSRHDLGRERFLERTWRWKEEHAGQIQNQLKRMGCSLDWKRERFTMDPGFSRAVREVFVSLYEQNLLYRGERIINWCPRCQTALSDLEVIPTERKSTLWYIRYPIEGVGSVDSVVIATTRPETLLGDTALAVHPSDERYLALHGKFARVPLINRKIPVIADPYVDQSFGSGALKVTPAHDFNDYDLGLKHGLEIVSVMGKDGTITEAGGPYAGLKFAEARARVVEDLTAQGLLIKTEDNANKVGLCQRCDTVAEPMVSKQWFVRIEPLARPAIAAVEQGRITFTPANWEKTYFEWMRNIRDWCVSRQLWWGHQIPAWYCDRCTEITVSRDDPKHCTACGSTGLTRDPDVLDTWFSSALWPFATLGWPERTPALKTFYPGAVLETGFDIIFFWVARMIMMGLHFMGEVPFRKVYLHAMVRDEKGQKMSKSRGNVIDPLVLIDQHGADSLRLTLASMAGQGRDVKLSPERVEGYRAFCNKLWNAVKFLHFQLDPEQGGPIEFPREGATQWVREHASALAPVHRWILGELGPLTRSVDARFAAFEIDQAARSLYDWSWYELCDWYIELCKYELKRGRAEREQTLICLLAVLEQALKLWHPILPFVTEQLWASLPGASERGLLMRTRYPIAQAAEYEACFPSGSPAQQEIQGIKGVLQTLRAFRGENSIAPRTEFVLLVEPASPAAREFFERTRASLIALGRLSAIEFVQALESGGNDGVTVVPIEVPAARLGIALKGLIDVAAELERLERELTKLDADIAFVTQKLGRESFVAKAPPELVSAERAKQTALEAKRAELLSSRERLRLLAP